MAEKDLRPAQLDGRDVYVPMMDAVDPVFLKRLQELSAKLEAQAVLSSASQTTMPYLIIAKEIKPIPSVAGKEAQPGWQDTLRMTADSLEQYQAMLKKHGGAISQPEKLLLFGALNKLVSHRNAYYDKGFLMEDPTKTDSMTGLARTMRRPAIVFGQEVWDKLTPDERLAVIAHEAGHHFRDLEFDITKFKGMKPEQIQAEMEKHLKVNECRADQMVPLELRSHLVSALTKLTKSSTFAPEVKQDIERIMAVIGDGVPDTHPDNAKRIAAAGHDHRGKDIKLDSDCKVIDPPSIPQGEKRIKEARIP